MSEEGRIAFLVQRDGRDAALEWVSRTRRIYRRAILNGRHHASTQEYRRKFIESYCDFKRWLSKVR